MGYWLDEYRRYISMSPQRGAEPRRESDGQGGAIVMVGGEEWNAVCTLAHATISWLDSLPKDALSRFEEKPLGYQMVTAYIIAKEMRKKVGGK